MDSRKKITIGIAVIAVVIVVGFIVLVWRPMATVPAPSPGTTSSSSSSPGSATMAPVPANAVVLNQGQSSTDPSVAVPVIQSVGAPNSDAQYRSYAIKIQGGQFIPSTVVLNYGDTMDLEITAVDGNYDFTQPDYGFHANIAKGATQRIQGNANIKGDFTFYCESCGGPAKGPVGHMIVK